MSTFFGGDQLVQVLKLNGNASGGTTIYTVPADRYAVVQVVYTGDTNFIVDHNSIISSTLIQQATGTEDITSFTIIAGEKVVKTTGSANYAFFIKEFKQP